MSSYSMKQFKARDVHLFVSDTFGKGQPHWPTSRAALGGLRLRQVADAIKIFVAQVYCDDLKGEAPPGMYESLKKNWEGLYGQIPTAFIRESDWNAAQVIDDAERRKFAILASSVKHFSAQSRDEEEEAFYEAKSFGSFIGYLECIPREFPHILAHVFGHLSDGFVYYDDSIPALPSEVVEQQSRAGRNRQVQAEVEEMVENSRTRRSPLGNIKRFFCDSARR